MLICRSFLFFMVLCRKCLGIFTGLNPKYKKSLLIREAFKAINLITACYLISICLLTDLASSFLAISTFSTPSV
jgi:hypothetical protein